MLRLFIVLFFVAQVLTQNLPTVTNINPCLKLDHKSKVNCESVSGTWAYADGMDPDECLDVSVTVSEATQKDIQKVKERCNGIEAKLYWDQSRKVEFPWSDSIKKLTFSKDVNDSLISKYEGKYIILNECRNIQQIDCETYGNVSILFASKFTPIAFQVPKGQEHLCVTDNPYDGFPRDVSYFYNNYTFCNSVSSVNSYISKLAVIFGVLNVIYMWGEASSV